MSWVLYEFFRPKINAILPAAWVCDKILPCDYSNETSSALFIGDWLKVEVYVSKCKLVSRGWKKKGVVTIALNKPKGFWKSSSSSSSLLLINYPSMNSPTISYPQLFMALLFLFLCIQMGSFYVLFKNEQECIIRFKNSRRSREFLKLIIHDCELFERLQNLWYRSTHSCTNI